MDKKFLNKSSNFFKREGFYVILFVCICVVATTAAIVAKNNKSSKKSPVVQEQKKQSVASTTPSTVKNNIPNALEVKDNKTNSAVSVPKNGTSSQSVSNAVDTTFTKPVDGALARGYSTDLQYCQTIGSYKTNHGIEISAKLNSEVHAVLDGKVEAIDNDKTELGEYIIVDHQNGLKTIYSNLREDVKVKVGDTVKKNQIIGYVGKTRTSYSQEKFGDHLHFEVMKGTEYVDPAKYIVYSKAAN
ncbi:M23 family metallopeptidase [Clostridium sp. 19966]|uniref:M23 family metallopeptidase n=1 Tax=Clostridium sp. 19966 TaxID=2768166 RepID=UPI0028DEDD42|nr:M23 family metallopeptidase [Clostridium sp. 19966]MDT8715579.1 M23 family metallopeptidase [Clostridium sp. 19966]